MNISFDSKILVFARFISWFWVLVFFLYQQQAWIPEAGGYLPVLALLYLAISTLVLVALSNGDQTRIIVYGMDLAFILLLNFVTLLASPVLLSLFLVLFLYGGFLRKGSWVHGSSLVLIIMMVAGFLLYRDSVPPLSYFYALLLAIVGIWIGFFAGKDAREFTQMSREVQSLREAQRKLEYQQKLVERHQYTIEELSTIDSLTRIYNRPYLLEKGTLVLEEAARKGESVGFILLDIDHFKKYNDNFGHLVGDKTLRIVADVMKGAVRADDLVGRYGGEEFLIIQPGRSLSESLVAAERIRQNVEKQAVTLLNQMTGLNIPLAVTISAGVVATDPNMPENIDALIHKADIALYTAKEKGRNQVQLYSP